MARKFQRKTALLFWLQATPAGKDSKHSESHPAKEGGRKAKGVGRWCGGGKGEQSRDFSRGNPWRSGGSSLVENGGTTIKRKGCDNGEGLRAIVLGVGKTVPRNKSKKRSHGERHCSEKASLLGTAIRNRRNGRGLKIRDASTEGEHSRRISLSSRKGMHFSYETGETRTTSTKIPKETNRLLFHMTSMGKTPRFHLGGEGRSKKRLSKRVTGDPAHPKQ